MIDEVKKFVYNFIAEQNCKDSEKQIIIDTDQSTNRVLIIDNGKRYFVGRPYEYTWIAPPETDVVIFVADNVDGGSQSLSTRLLSDFVRRNEPVLESRYAVLRHLFNTGDKCRHFFSAYPVRYEILLMDVGLSIEEKKFCMRRLY